MGVSYSLGGSCCVSSLPADTVEYAVPGPVRASGCGTVVWKHHTQCLASHRPWPQQHAQGHANRLMTCLLGSKLRQAPGPWDINHLVA